MKHLENAFRMMTLYRIHWNLSAQRYSASTVWFWFPRFCRFNHRFIWSGHFQRTRAELWYTFGNVWNHSDSHHMLYHLTGTRVTTWHLDMTDRSLRFSILDPVLRPLLIFGDSWAEENGLSKDPDPRSKVILCCATSATLPYFMYFSTVPVVT